MPQIRENSITWVNEDFYGGFAPNFQSSVSLTDLRKLGSGFAFAKNFNPFHIPGMAYPGIEPSGISGTSSSLPNAAQVSGVAGFGLNVAWTIGGAKLQQMTAISSAPILSSTAPYPFTLVAAGVHSGDTSFVGQDTAIYKVGTATRMFFSYVDNVDWDVGMVTLGTPDTVDVDYMTTDVGSGGPIDKLGTVAADLTNGVGKEHPLFVSRDGFLYIGSGKHLHKFDGITSTFHSQVLKLPEGMEIKGITEDEFNLIIFADSDNDTGRRSLSVAYYWGPDRGVNFDKDVDLQDDRVSAPFLLGGTAGCFTNNRSGINTLRLYNGNTGEFDRMGEFRGTLPTVGGVEIQDNLVKWNSSGKIFAYGKYKKTFPAAMHHFGTVGNTSGFLRSFAAGRLLASGGTGTDTGLVGFDNFASSADFVGMAAFPKFPTGMIGRLISVDITFAKIVSGNRALELQMFTNNTQVFLESAIKVITVNNRTRSYRRDKNDAKLPHFTSLAPRFIWSSGDGSSDAPGIESIKASFEPIRNKSSYA